MDSTPRFLFSSHIYSCIVQFQDDSPQLSVIILGIFLSLDATFGADPAIMHDVPGSSSAITASANDDGSTRAARFGEAYYC